MLLITRKYKNLNERLPRTLIFFGASFIVTGAIFTAMFFALYTPLTAFGVGLMIIGSSFIIYPPSSTPRIVSFENKNGEKNHEFYSAGSSLLRNYDLKGGYKNIPSEMVVDSAKPADSPKFSEGRLLVSVETEALKINSLELNLVFNLVLSSLIIITILSLYSLYVSHLEVYISVFALVYVICLTIIQPNKNFYDLPAYALFISFALIIILKIFEILG